MINYWTSVHRVKSRWAFFNEKVFTSNKKLCYNHNVKPIFYVFLDFDGVLYDLDFVIREAESGRIHKGSLIDNFKPESMEAVNFLLENLDKKFDARLVISSSWRWNMQRAKKVLKDNGLVYNKEILSTPISDDSSKRGREILDFLSDKVYQDFVVLDDEMFDYDKCISSDKIIKTDMRHQSLSKKQVDDFLECVFSTSKDK